MCKSIIYNYIEKYSKSLFYKKYITYYIMIFRCISPSNLLVKKKMDKQGN